MRRGHVLALIAAAAGVALTLSLGNWQMRRGDAKQALQAEWDAAQRGAPVQLDSQAALDEVANSLPRRVRLRGSFVTATVYLDNRMRESVAGFDVVGAVSIGTGLPLVAVDRGWAARDPRDRARLPAAPTPDGEAVIDGLAVAGMPRLLELGNEPERRIPGIWQNLDLDDFERLLGQRVARFVVRQTSESPDGLRRDRPQPALGVDKHRGYALQWYSLAALIAVLTGWFGLRGLR
jgi:cytochrome oxidase assembly protein ShyY1